MVCGPRPGRARVLAYLKVPRSTWLLRASITMPGRVDSTCLSGARRLDGVMLPRVWGSWKTQGLMPEKQPWAALADVARGLCLVPGDGNFRTTLRATVDCVLALPCAKSSTCISLRYSSQP